MRLRLCNNKSLQLWDYAVRFEGQGRLEYYSRNGQGSWVCCEAGLGVAIVMGISTGVLVEERMAFASFSRVVRTGAVISSGTPRVQVQES